MDFANPMFLNTTNNYGQVTISTEVDVSKSVQSALIAHATAEREKKLQHLTDNVTRIWARWEKKDEAKKNSWWTQWKNSFNKNDPLEVLFFAMSAFGIYSGINLIALTWIMSMFWAIVLNITVSACCGLIYMAVWYLEINDILYYVRLQNLLKEHLVNSPRDFSDLLLKHHFDALPSAVIWLDKFAGIELDALDAVKGLFLD